MESLCFLSVTIHLTNYLAKFHYLSVPNSVVL